MYSQDGRDQPQMPMYIRMQSTLTWLFRILSMVVGSITFVAPTEGSGLSNGPLRQTCGNTLYIGFTQLLVVS
jgi:hypothetical protein